VLMQTPCRDGEEMGSERRGGVQLPAAAMLAALEGGDGGGATPRAGAPLRGVEPTHHGACWPGRRLDRQRHRYYHRVALERPGEAMEHD